MIVLVRFFFICAASSWDKFLTFVNISFLLAIAVAISNHENKQIKPYI